MTCFILYFLLKYPLQLEANNKEELEQVRDIERVYSAIINDYTHKHFLHLHLDFQEISNYSQL